MSLIPNPNINGLTNPLATNLQANNFEIQAASKVTGTTVETDNIRLVPGSGSTYIDVEDNLRIAGLKALEFSTKPAVGGNIRADSGAGGLHISGLVSDVKADVLGYDSLTGQVVIQPAGGSGTLNSVVGGTAITVDNTDPFNPIINNAGVTALNSATGSLTVAAGSGISVGTVGGTITVTNTSPSSGGTLTGVGAGTGVLVDNTVPAVPVVSNDGVLTVNTAKGALTVAAGTGISVGTVGGTITITNSSPSSGGTLTGVGAGAGITVDNTVPAVPVVANDGVLTVNSEKGALTIAAGTDIGITTVGSTITINNTATNFRPAFEYFVATNGNDLTGDGSMEAPFATIQKAVDIAEAAVGAAVVYVSTGTYSENVLIERGDIAIQGASESSEGVNGTIVVGLISVSINTGTSDLFGNQVILKGLFISGGISDTTASVQHTLILEDCRIDTENLDSYAISVSGTVADQRTYLTNCRITQTATAATTNALVLCNTGRLLVDMCNFTVRTTSSCVSVGGTAFIAQFSLSTLESAYTGNIPQPIVSISSSSTSPHNIALNSFSLPSATAKLQSSGIAFVRATVGVSVGVLLNNFFNIAGTSSATDVITKNVGTTLFLQISGNQAVTGTSSGITAGTTVSITTPIGEPAPAGASAWSTFPATQAVDMATFDIDNAGAIGANGITNNGTLETRDVGVVSIDGTAPATINMALTNTSVSPEVLTMAYNPFGEDKLEVNKGMILDGGLIMGAGGGVNNIENVLGLYSSEIVESKTLQAIDINAIGDGSIIYKTIDPLFPAGTVCSITYPDPIAQNTVLYATGALSLDDPPNGGLPAQIIINGVPQTLNGSDWSTYAATQNVDMATFDIDNAGAIGAVSVDTSDFITSATTITGLDVVATNSLSVDGLSVKPVLDFTATNELFVAKNGDDTTGNGSTLQPFATIQKAIDETALITPKTGITVIQIANGEYNETITINGAGGGYIQLNGSATSQNNTFGVVLKGSILIDLDAGPSDLINRQVIFSGLQLDAIINNGSSIEHTVAIQNCRFYPSASSNGSAIFDTATKNRVLIDNCEYTNDFPSGTPAPCFEFAGESTVSMSKMDVQSTNNSSIILLGGTSYLQRLENCYIENKFVSPTVPLLNITSTSTQTHSIGLNIFSIESGSGITTPAIITANGGTLFVISNNFSLAGTNPTTGNVIQYAGAAPTLIFGNNTAVPLYASGIQSGITLVPAAGVGSQPIKATTVTASGAITGGSVSAGSGALSGGAISGTTLTTTGAIKSSGTLQLSGNVISNASNNTSLTGVNSITMAGTTPAITAVNNLGISNTNATVPLTITNSGDNPHIVCNNAGASTTVPVEINLVNGPLTLAYGNQGTDPRGAFFFFNGKDIIRIQSALQRVQMSYSPFAPTLATSGAAGTFVAGTAGAFVSGVPKLLGTQTTTLTASNFPIIPGGFGTPFYVGLNGYLNTAVLNSAHDFVVTVTYTRTRSAVTVGPFPLYGAIYPVSAQASGAFYTPLNGTTYNEAVVGERITFTHNDVLAIQVFGTYTGGSPPNLVTPPTGLAAVFSPFLV